MCCFQMNVKLMVFNTHVQMWSCNYLYSSTHTTIYTSPSCIVCTLNAFHTTQVGGWNAIFTFMTLAYLARFLKAFIYHYNIIKINSYSKCHFFNGAQSSIENWNRNQKAMLNALCLPVKLQIIEIINAYFILKIYVKSLTRLR